jgi:hypothetical protein
MMGLLIRNYTLNFSSGRDSLNFSVVHEKLAFTEIQRVVGEFQHG